MGDAKTSQSSGLGRKRFAHSRDDAAAVAAAAAVAPRELVRLVEADVESGSGSSGRTQRAASPPSVCSTRRVRSARSRSSPTGGGA